MNYEDLVELYLQEQWRKDLLRILDSNTFASKMKHKDPSSHKTGTTTR